MHPPPTKAIANHKGGVGKTTTAVNLCAGLAERGKRALLLDLDAQAHATISVGQRVTTRHSPMYAVLMEPQALAAHAVDTGYGFDVVPAARDMDEVELAIGNKPGGKLELREAIAELPAGRYDAIIIDCPPNLGHRTQSALIAAQGVIVPIPMEALPFEGFGQFITALEGIRKHDNPGLTIEALFETMSDDRTKLAYITRGMVDAAIGGSPVARVDALLTERVRRNVALAEAPGLGRPRPVMHYKPDSHGAADYRALTAALVERGIL